MRIKGIIEEHRTAIVKLAAAYVCIRLYLYVLDVVAAQRSFNGNLDGPILSWDAWHYLQIARSGYPTIAPRVGGQLTFSNGAFGPIFPLLIWLMHKTSIPLVTSAVTVSVVGGLVATVFVWRLAVSITNEAVGLSSALIFVALPGMAVTWGVLYSECVGLALAAACLLLAVKKRWVTAGLVGAIAVLTSPIALVLVLSPLARALLELRRRRISAAWIAVALIPSGFLLFAAWLGVRYHDALFWWHLQRGRDGARTSISGHPSCACLGTGPKLVARVPRGWSGSRSQWSPGAWLPWFLQGCHWR